MQAPRIRRVLWVLLAAFGCVGACSTLRAHELDRRFGNPQVRDRVVPEATEIDYWTDVEPILASRCVVCHGCYDAPCQVKLGSPESIDRGATTAKVYDATRLREADPTRLFEDATSTAQWRARGFHPILNEREQTPVANRVGSPMARLLALKAEHPVKPGALLPDDVDVTLDREQVCPAIEDMDAHEQAHPQWGMPFGVTGLGEAEQDTLLRWLEEGATHTAPPPLPKDLEAEVARWEAYFNGDTLVDRLASRYMFEHLFLAHLYFEEQQDGANTQFFELVRSRTPPGRPIDRIATRRPYDDPGVERVYYRLRPVHEVIVAKLHLPYALSQARLARWKALFQDADFEVTTLPSYAPEVASNPFIAFAQLPTRSRYRFMLEEAQFTLMGFIKGAVCRGPIALNVIDDHFYVLFIDPEVDEAAGVSTLVQRNAENLRMPAASGSSAPPMVTWARDAKREKAYMKAKRAAYREGFGGPRRVSLETLWDGDGDNRNATLTVFRHFDSASVVKGLVGEHPKTTWVLDYPLLERIHYLLVAGFDVYGNIGHQLATRTYMDFLRMESEFNFLGFLPEGAREKERAFWYRHTSEPINREIVGALDDIDIETTLVFETDDPKLELYGMLHDHFAPLATDRYLPREQTPPEVSTAMTRLAALHGKTLEHFPEVAFVLVPDAPTEDRVFTLVHDAAHFNIASPLNEDDRRAPAEDTLTVARGFIGTYPNALYLVPSAQLEAFASAVEGLGNEADYAALQVRYGVRRTSEEFWSVLDQLHALYRETYPLEAGLFDISRVENR